MSLRISFAAQYGDGYAANAVQAHLDQLNALVATAMRGDEYPAEIEEIALFLRCDGHLATWNTVGVDRIRRRRRLNNISADVMMRVEDWRGRSPGQIRAFLVKWVGEAFDQLLKKLAREGILFDRQTFMSEWSQVAEAFLTGKDIDIVVGQVLCLRPPA